MLQIQAEKVTVRHSAEWSVAPAPLKGLQELVYRPVSEMAGTQPASIKIRFEHRADRDEALLRLQQIGDGIGAPPSAYLTIGGWPAVQYRRLEERPQPSQGPQFRDPMVWRITTVVAVDGVLVRMEAALPSDASVDLKQQVETIGRSLGFAPTADPERTQRDLDSLQSAAKPRLAAPSALPPQTQAGPDENVDSGFTLRPFNGGRGEIEIAVSPNGQTIIIGRQGDWSASTNGGQTFTNNGTVGAFDGGDPSIGWGVGGAFYYAGIDRGCRPADMAGPFGYACTGMARSTDNGVSFPLVTPAVVCPNADPAAMVVVPGSCFPDQEHIAVDRWNAGTGDQIYSTWRNFDATDQDPGLVCSQDSGQTWSAPVDVGAGAFPRIGVGRDGAVYVVWYDGGNYMLRKFSSCATGLVAQPAVMVTTRTPVVCPFAGHDRCDQNPSSQTVAVDDVNPNHVYFAYAENTAAGNEDIFVQDSLDGGATWPAGRVVQVNTAIPGQRIMPWMCTTGGEAFVGWYDRRNAPLCPAPPCAGIQNDLTDYYVGRTRLDVGGNLSVGTELKINEVADPWCASGWPCSTRAVNSAESCSVQPQLAGQCCDNTVANCPGSQQACDFSQAAPGDNICPAGETCNTGGGCPKYGDYNGIACNGGRVLVGWASATSPPSILPPSNSIGILFSGKLLGDAPSIQVPGSLNLGTSCGENLTATLDVCNTGNATLEIAPITSSSSRFAVTTPSGGYPVNVSPDFCFPFQVVFTAPVSPGASAATLTIPSDDPLRPNTTVAVSAILGAGDIDTVIADSGSYGDVCRGDFKDLDLTISNGGVCPLSISSIASSSPEFQAAGVVTFPFLVAPGTATAIPIRLAPTSLGAKAATITVGSNDPDTPASNVAVSGNTPPGDIRVTGSTDFGDVCAEDLAEKTVSVCNVGPCDLAVAAASIDCLDFTLINNPFPATVSPDSCLDLTIRFTPTSVGPKSCTLTITSDDPDTPATMLTLTANTPVPSIDVPPDQGFPPTVIQSVAACDSSQPFPVSNTGTCDLKITAFAITTNPAEFSLVGLPSFPIILEPGHIAGAGDLETAFAPGVLDRQRSGEASVTWVTDPIVGTTSTVTRALCGEGVRTGARVLVTQGGVPLANVKAIKLQRTQGNRNKDHLDTVDQATELALQTMTPVAPCASFQFHREYGTVSNPIQLLPGSYVVTVSARINGRLLKKTIGFDVTSCGFNSTIVVDF